MVVVVWVVSLSEVGKQAAVGNGSGSSSYRLHASRAAQELVTRSARKWKEEEGDMRDDISAIVIKVGFIS